LIAPLSRRGAGPTNARSSQVSEIAR